MPAATAQSRQLLSTIGGVQAYGDYASAVDDPRIDAVVIAVPPRFHLDLTLQALAAGKHILVEKPAFVRMADYHTVVAARNAAKRVVLVGKRSLQAARRLPAEAAERGRHRRDGVRSFHDCGASPEVGRRLAQRRNDGGWRRIFREGIHWLHLAGSLGPTITSIQGFRPDVPRDGPDTQVKSMMVAFRYDNGAVGALCYSREIPSLCGDSACPSCSAARASSHSSRTARSSWSAAVDFPGWCSRASGTSVATARCIAISSARSATAARRK